MRALLHVETEIDFVTDYPDVELPDNLVPIPGDEVVFNEDYSNFDLPVGPVVVMDRKITYSEPPHLEIWACTKARMKEMQRTMTSG